MVTRCIVREGEGVSRRIATQLLLIFAMIRDIKQTYAIKPKVQETHRLQEWGKWRNNRLDFFQWFNHRLQSMTLVFLCKEDTWQQIRIAARDFDIEIDGKEVVVGGFDVQADVCN